MNHEDTGIDSMMVESQTVEHTVEAAFVVDNDDVGKEEVTPLVQR